MEGKPDHFWDLEPFRNRPGYIAQSKSILKAEEMKKRGSKREAISSVLCDHLEGWDTEDGREMQEGGDMGI